MSKFKVLNTQSGYTVWHAYIEANSEEEALKEAKNGDCDWDTDDGFESDGDVNDYEIDKSEQQVGGE